MRRSAPLPLAVLLPLAALGAQEKLTLRYAFEPGQVTWTQRTQETTVAAGGPAIKIALSIWNECKVVDVKDGVASIEIRYARITTRFETEGDKRDYDSAAGGPPPREGWPSVLADLVDKTVSLRVDTTGKVLERKLPVGFEKRMEQPGMGNVSWQPQFVVLPKDPIAIGETWNGELEIPMRSKGAKASVGNKLTGVRENVVSVEHSFVIEDAPSENNGAGRVRMVKGDGTTRVGLCNLMPVEGSIDVELKSGDEMKASLHLTARQVSPLAAKKPAEATKEEPKKEEKKDGSK